MHQRFAGISSDSLLGIAAQAEDSLSRWTADYMAHAADTSLYALLKAGMQRTYSANPSEIFFTGGGQQSFANFDSTENTQVYSVHDAFQNSINLSFVRLMRDEVNFHIAQMVSPKEIIGADSPSRRRYLERFALRDGETFLRRFFEEYHEPPSPEGNNTAPETFWTTSPTAVPTAWPPPTITCIRIRGHRDSKVLFWTHSRIRSSLRGI